MRRSVNESEAVRILPNPVTHTHTYEQRMLCVDDFSVGPVCASVHSVHVQCATYRGHH